MPQIPIVAIEAEFGVSNRTAVAIGSAALLDYYSIVIEDDSSIVIDDHKA